MHFLSTETGGRHPKAALPSFGPSTSGEDSRRGWYRCNVQIPCDVVDVTLQKAVGGDYHYQEIVLVIHNRNKLPLRGDPTTIHNSDEERNIGGVLQCAPYQRIISPLSIRPSGPRGRPRTGYMHTVGEYFVVVIWYVHLHHDVYNDADSLNFLERIQLLHTLRTMSTTSHAVIIWTLGSAMAKCHCPASIEPFDLPPGPD